MTNPLDVRKRRREADLKELEKLRCRAIDWRIDGSSPDTLHVTYNIRSVVGIDNLGQPQYSHTHQVEVSIPQQYPMAPPVATMKKGKPVPFHPNFYANGLICTQNTQWTPEQSLAMFCLQIARMLQFSPEVTDASNAANWKARDWYNINLAKGTLFPTDPQNLPTLGTDDDFSLEADFEILEIRTNA